MDGGRRPGVYPDTENLQSPPERPRKVKHSIRWKLLKAMMGLIIGLVTTLTLTELLLQQKSLENDLNRRVDLMKDNLIEHGRIVSKLLLAQVENDVAGFNFSHIQEVLTISIQESPQLSYGILMNTAGVAFIHTRRPDLQQEVLQEEADRYALAQKTLTSRDYPDNSAVEFIMPVQSGTRQWGVLRLGFSTHELNREIARSRDDIVLKTQSMILTTAGFALFFILLGAVVVMVISTTLSKPLTRLTESVREITRGNYEAAARLLKASMEDGHGKSRVGGEIALLSAAFVEMAEEIRHSRRQLEEYNRTLEEKVAERTRELELAYAKLKELDQMKTNFLSTVSHELRTPLTSVLGFARIIQKKFESALYPHLAAIEDKKVKKAIQQVMDNTQIIVEEGQRLTSLINDVLDLAKMEAGRIEWNIQEIDIQDVVDRAMAATAALFIDKPVAARKDIADRLPKIQGDRDRLIQVAINLISNAVKFTQEGSVTCRVRMQGQEIIVSVIDTGCGIKPEDQPLVFEKFKQVGDTLTDKPTGTGLGLPICKEIVEHHGGRLWVESEVGKGSTFSFSLTSPEAHLAGEREEEYQVSFVSRRSYGEFEEKLAAYLDRRAERNARRTRTILIIDDDPNICILLQQELAAEGYRAIAANNGNAALVMVERDCPDLIILDVKMPQLSGFEVALHLRTNPATLRLPIILHTVVERRKLSAQLGIDRLLTKPVPGPKLLGAVRQVLAAPQDAPAKILLFALHPQRAELYASWLSTLGHTVRICGEEEDFAAVAASFEPFLTVADANAAATLPDDAGLRANGDRTLFLLLEENPPT